MFNKTINNCGVVSVAYGVPSGGGGSGNFTEVLMRFFLSFLFFMLIPVLLFVGIWAIANKKQYSKKKRIWTVVTVLAIYFAVLIGVILLIIL